MDLILRSLEKYKAYNPSIDYFLFFFFFFTFFNQGWQDSNRFDSLRTHCSIITPTFWFLFFCYYYYYYYYRSVFYSFLWQNSSFVAEGCFLCRSSCLVQITNSNKETIETKHLYILKYILFLEQYLQLRQFLYLCRLFVYASKIVSQIVICFFSLRYVFACLFIGCLTFAYKMTPTAMNRVKNDASIYCGGSLFNVVCHRPNPWNYCGPTKWLRSSSSFLLSFLFSFLVDAFSWITAKTLTWSAPSGGQNTGISSSFNEGWD